MSLMQRLGYGFVRSLVRLLLWLLTRTSVQGLEKLPHTGAGIVVCNHIHTIDPAVLVGMLPRPIILMSKVENARGILRPFMAMAGAFTVRRGSADRQAMQQSAAALQRGLLLGIFPEGTRSPNGQLQEGRGGAAMLALSNNVPLIPIAITGSTQVFQRRFPWVRLPRGRVLVTIGEPFQLTAHPGESRHDQRQRLTEQMMLRIAALLPAEMQGYYQQVVAASPFREPLEAAHTESFD